jgi:hypothetical protein
MTENGDFTHKHGDFSLDLLLIYLELDGFDKQFCHGCHLSKKINSIFGGLKKTSPKIQLALNPKSQLWLKTKNTLVM